MRTSYHSGSSLLLSFIPSSCPRAIMRQATKPIAIIPSGKQRSTADSRSGNISGDSGVDSSGDEKEYFHPPLRDRPYTQPFANTAQAYQQDYETDSNLEDLLLVGSLPSSRRERRFLVSTGGQELGGYGHSTTGPNTRLVIAPRASNHPTRQRAQSSPPPAPLLQSRKDHERGDKISRIPKMALPESLASSLDSSSIRMSYGSLRENSFQQYYQNGLSKASAAEPKSLPYSRNGSSADIFSRLRSNNNIQILNEDISNGGDVDLTNPVPILQPKHKVGSVSGLASLLGDYTIGETANSPTNKLLREDSHIPLDEPSIRGNIQEPNNHNVGTLSFSSNYSDLWHLNSNYDLTMVQSPSVSGHDDFSTASLTGLNILESTRSNLAANLENNLNNVNNTKTEASSMLHSTSSYNHPVYHVLIGSMTEHERRVELNNCNYHDQIDSGQHGAFELDMDR